MYQERQERLEEQQNLDFGPLEGFLSPPSKRVDSLIQVYRGYIFVFKQLKHKGRKLSQDV